MTVGKAGRTRGHCHNPQHIPPSLPRPYDAARSTKEHFNKEFSLLSTGAFVGEEESKSPSKPAKGLNRTIVGLAAIMAASVVFSLLVAYHAGYFGTVDETLPWDSHRLEGPWLVTEGDGEPGNVTLVVYTNGTINEWGIRNPFNRSRPG